MGVKHSKEDLRIAVTANIMGLLLCASSSSLAPLIHLLSMKRLDEGPLHCPSWGLHVCLTAAVYGVPESLTFRPPEPHALQNPKQFCMLYPDLIKLLMYMKSGQPGP
jgi:hypothetical protein